MLFLGIIDEAVKHEVEVAEDVILEMDDDDSDELTMSDDMEVIAREYETEISSSQSQQSSSGPSQGSLYQPSPTRADPAEVPLEDKKKAVAFWNSGKTGRLKFSNVKHTYTFVPNELSLYRWEKQIIEGGSMRDKLAIIYAETREKFIKARESRFIIHDIHLRRWALQANAVVKLPGFTASPRWIDKLKSVNRIVSR